MSNNYHSFHEQYLDEEKDAICTLSVQAFLNLASNLGMTRLEIIQYIMSTLNIGKELANQILISRASKKSYEKIQNKEELMQYVIFGTIPQEP